MRGYEAACSTLVAMAPIGGYWAEFEHLPFWQRALSRLSPFGGSGRKFWLKMQRYPGTLLFYALGLGALAAEKFQFLEHFFATPIHREHDEDVSAVEYLPPFGMYGTLGQDAKILEGMDGKQAPLNDWIHDVLREPVRHMVPNDYQYTLLFDKLEILMSLSAARHFDAKYPGTSPPYFVAGGFGYRAQNAKRILRENPQCDLDRGRQVAVSNGWHHCGYRRSFLATAYRYGSVDSETWLEPSPFL